MKKAGFKGASWDSMFLTFAKVLTMVFGIVLTKIMSIGLSLEVYGSYAQVNIVTSIGTSMILLGLGDAVNYYFNKKNSHTNLEDRVSILNTIFAIECLIGIVLAIIITIGRGFIGGYFENEAIESLLIVSSVLPMLANVMYFYQVLYISVGKAKLMSLYNLTLMILKIVSAYISVYVIGDIFWIYVVLVALDFIQIVIFKFTLKSHNVSVNIFKSSFNHIKPILSYSLPMGVYAITSVLTRDIDKLLIGRMDGTETMAIYTNCSKLLPFDFLVVSFATVLIPYIVRYVTEGNKEQTVRLFSNYMKVGYYSVWILGATVLIAPATMISFLYDDKFVVGLPIFIIYIFDSMMRFASMHLILTASGKTKQIMMYSFISLGLNVVLNIAFYHLWGMIGPAIATLVVAIIYTCLIMGKTLSVIHCSVRDVFSFKDISMLLGSLVVLVLLCKGIYMGLCAIGMHEYISMITAMAVLGFAALAIHFKKIKHVLVEINSFRM